MHAVRGQQDVPAKARCMRGSARSPLEPWTCRPGFREFGAAAAGIRRAQENSDALSGAMQQRAMMLREARRRLVGA